MATIYTDSFHGGSGHTDGDDLPMAKVCQDVADDLADLKVAVITSANASDLATAITLVNEIKTSLNTVAGKTIRTINGGDR